MPSPSSNTNVYADEDADGLRVRVEGEFLHGHLTATVRPTEEEVAPGMTTDSEDSETSDWGRPEVLPIDMGIGHFMLNTQSGAICWCPSGTLQPDILADWVALGDPSSSTSVAPGDGESVRTPDNRAGHHAEVNDDTPPPLGTHGRGGAEDGNAMEEDGGMNSAMAFSSDEPAMEIFMDTSAGSGSACSQ